MASKARTGKTELADGPAMHIESAKRNGFFYHGANDGVILNSLEISL